MVVTTGTISGGGGGILYPAQGNSMIEDRGKLRTKKQPKVTRVGGSKKK